MNFIDSRRLLKIFPLLVLMFVGFGCEIMETVESTGIPQSRIQQSYVVSASRERTSVSAHFYYGNWGKSVDLDAPSKIEHNGAALPQTAISFPFGTSYETSLPGLQTNHSFVYTNNDGQVFRNELNFEPIELQFGEITVSRAQEIKIWLSRVVGKDETVSISLKSRAVRPAAGSSNAAPKSNNPAPPEDYEIFLNDELDERRAAIILKPKNLKKFVLGKAVLELEVSRTLPLQQAADAGGTMRWSYASSREANVTD